MDESGLQTRMAVEGVGPATAPEGDLVEDLLLLEAVLPPEPGHVPASLSGEDVTLDHSRTRRLHLRKIQAVTLTL